MNKTQGNVRNECDNVVLPGYGFCLPVNSNSSSLWEINIPKQILMYSRRESVFLIIFAYLESQTMKMSLKEKSSVNPTGCPEMKNLWIRGKREMRC